MQYSDYYDERDGREMLPYRPRPRSKKDFEVPRGPSPPDQDQRYQGSRAHGSIATSRSINKNNRVLSDRRTVEQDNTATLKRHRTDHNDDVQSRRIRAEDHRSHETALKRYIPEFDKQHYFDPAAIHTDKDIDSASDQFVLGWLDNVVEDSPLVTTAPTKQPEARPRIDSHYHYERRPLKELPRQGRVVEKPTGSIYDDRTSASCVQPFQPASSRVSTGAELFIPQSWDGTIIRVPANYSVVVPPSYHRTRIGDDTDDVTEAPRRRSVPLTTVRHDRSYPSSRRYLMHDSLDY